MTFNSIEFLIFFPVFTLIYFNIPHKFRSYLIFFGSCFFYMYLIPKYIIIILALVVLDYLAALLISTQKNKSKKLFLILSILANIIVLGYYKYFNFIGSNLNTVFSFAGLPLQIPYLDIILPIGLSFHTFQSLGYVLDVYLGKIKPEKNILQYACYVLFFPQLVAGPIERAANLLPQFKFEHKFDLVKAKSGLFLILIGFYKKVIVADTLALFVDTVFLRPQNFNTLEHIVATLFFSIQVYCDFSGYSDIARGCARILGFELMVNFRRPFSSESFPAVWRNWHISLSSWLRDFIFKPIIIKTENRFLAILITFIISGIWHGANWTFIFFGIINALLVYVSHLLKGPSKPDVGYFKLFLRWFKNLVLFSIGTCFFRAQSLTDVFYIYKNMYTNIINLNYSGFYKIDLTQLLLGLFLVAALELIHLYEERPLNWLSSKFKSKMAQLLVNYYVFLFLLILALISLSETSRKATTFIYFQF